ncbi:MAG: 5-formyltetrahydrofolate cyclo-ligase [Candidatus Kryptoniota bacterium]
MGRLEKTKDDLRKMVLKLRESMSEDEALERSKSVLMNLENLPEYRNAGVVHTYIASKPNEVDTIMMIARSFARGKRIAVPIIIDRKERKLGTSELMNLGDVTTGPFDIKEPKVFSPIPIEEVDIFIVPVIAVDRQGNRIGWGFGYYDNLLRDQRKPKVALAYDFQVVDAIQSSAEDVRVDYIVTEHEIIRTTIK